MSRLVRSSMYCTLKSYVAVASGLAWPTFVLLLCLQCLASEEDEGGVRAIPKLWLVAVGCGWRCKLEPTSALPC